MTKLLRFALVLAVTSLPWATSSLGDTPAEKKTAEQKPARIVAGQPHPAVVRVRASENGGASFGSGTLIGRTEKHGVVLTNWHVVRDATGQISVRFPDGFRSAATVLETDETWDLAALMIWRPDVEPVPIVDAKPQSGDRLTIAGYGSGTYREATGKVTQFVSPGQNHPFEMVEVDVEARSGDSGGPILNESGQMAGVLFGSAEGHTNGSHSPRVLWFIKRALAKTPKLAASVVVRSKED
ncbi:MAG: serine protease [Thermoguttaceae bacterium]